MEVSVIIPTYNRPDKLRACVQSVLGQTRSPDEIIVVDDASDRSYRDVIEELGQRKGEQVRLEYMKLPTGGGASHARNKGAQRARGDLLMFIDDDDTWLPSKLERQLPYFSDENIGLVYAGRRVVSEDGNVLYCIDPAADGKIHDELLVYNCIGTTSSVAVRASLFRATGGFDASLPALQDYDLWIRLARHTQVAFDAAHTVCWTVHASAEAQMAGDPKIYRDAYNRLEQKYSAARKRLSSKERRRGKALSWSTIADKYARAGAYRQQVQCALRSLLAYPTLAGMSRLLPYRIWLRLRMKFRRCQP